MRTPSSGSLSDTNTKTLKYPIFYPLNPIRTCSFDASKEWPLNFQFQLVG